MWSDDPRVARWVRQKDFEWTAPTGQRARKAYSKATVYRRVRKGELLAKEDPRRPGYLLLAVDARGDLIETTPEQRAAIQADEFRNTLAKVESSGSEFGKMLARFARILLPVSVADAPKPNGEECLSRNPDARK